jgi:hypothetical protein
METIVADKPSPKNDAVTILSQLLMVAFKQKL